MSRRRLSTGRSNVSSDGPQVDTAAIIKCLSPRFREMAEGRTRTPPLGPIRAAPALPSEKEESPSRGGGSVLKQCRRGECISAVSTYHRTKREGLRAYRTSVPNENAVRSKANRFSPNICARFLKFVALLERAGGLCCAIIPFSFEV